MKLSTYSTTLRRAARKLFGWTTLRPNQLAAMRAVMKRRDALVVLPTGAGKSAIYQIPASLIPGPTVVVSPLLALQQDQIAALNERRRPELRAVRISSDETPAQQAEAIAEVRAGRAEFLFITPEQLANPERTAEVQEIGRAGRDGEPARVLLLWQAEDVGLRRFFTGGLPDATELRDLAALLRREPHTKGALRELTGLGPRRLGQYLSLLEQVGAAEPRGQRLGAPRYSPKPVEAGRAALAEAERQQSVTRSRTDMMRAFAETTGCRGQALLAYFGEQMTEVCGHCDNCLAGTSVADDGARGPFPVHSQVRHPEWGGGLVLSYEDDRMTVLFDEVGYKTLSVRVVSEQGLLTLD
ncbi:DUF3553 domain-containing protein [Micromonospora sp. B11E3]|uniref:DUF3553 domain-containing protein n=1 Tax=Micromonospora sp. B11E3 TaxID=3153562 RepID=UPI00325F92B9